MEDTEENIQEMNFFRQSFPGIFVASPNFVPLFEEFSSIFKDDGGLISNKTRSDISRQTYTCLQIYVPI